MLGNVLEARLATDRLNSDLRSRENTCRSMILAEKRQADGPRFGGIIPPLVTPLTGRDALDKDGLHRLLARVVDGGVSGVFILGTTGEAPSLSYRLRRELICEVCATVAGRVPVLVGITDTAYIESVQLAEVASRAGAAAVVLSTPYYFPAGQTELIGYLRNITSDLPLPLMLYNMPSLTKVWFEIETLRELAEIEQIAGVKDSSGDLNYFAKLVALRERRPDWSIMMGPEHLLADAIRLGGTGGVCGGGNVFPRLFVQAYEAAVRNDQSQVQQLRQRIDQFGRLYTIGKYASRFIKATKCALSILGVCDDFMAEPFHRFLPIHREQVRQILVDQFADMLPPS
jgi:4-hydroxy-tetrahydrodipicolinate synthase